MAMAQTVMMDFKEAQAVRACWIVNDGVMGGVSTSRLRHDPEGMIFEGTVSLDNNGGFASMRCAARFAPGTRLLELRARGDGQRYKLIARTDKAQRVTYESDFVAEQQWAPHLFSAEKFDATFRGRRVQAPPLALADVMEMGILIADKQAGDFRLQVDQLKAL
jgi:hypothetical protein